MIKRDGIYEPTVVPSNLIQLKSWNTLHDVHQLLWGNSIGKEKGLSEVYVIPVFKQKMSLNNMFFVCA